MTTEYVSAAEVAAGLLQPEKLARVVSAYEADGLCVLCNVIPPTVLDELSHRYDFDAAHRYVSGDPFKGGQKGPALNPDYNGNLHLQVVIPYAMYHNFWQMDWGRVTRPRPPQHD